MDQCKRCSKCGETKPRDQFGSSRQKPDGLFPYCRPCKRLASNASHHRHKAERNAKKRDGYRANPGPYKDRANARYARDPETVKQAARRWAASNPARRLEIRRQSFHRRYAIAPERSRESWRKRQAAVRRGCAVYPFTTEQLAAKVAYWGSRCWVCSGAFEAIDHVKPLAKQGPHILANLRPICTACNTRKRDKWPFAA